MPANEPKRRAGPRGKKDLSRLNGNGHMLFQNAAKAAFDPSAYSVDALDTIPEQEGPLLYLSHGDLVPTPMTVDLPTLANDELSLPPLPRFSCIKPSTFEYAEGSIDALTPKKIQVQEPFDKFQSGIGQIKEEPKKKFCVFCGMQVEPHFLTAKFCAYCGMEHVQLAPTVPNDVKEAPGLENEPLTLSNIGELSLWNYCRTDDIAANNEFGVPSDIAGTAGPGFPGITDVICYDGAAPLLSGGTLYGPESAEHTDNLQSMLGTPYRFSAPLPPGLPSHGLAW